MTTPSGTPMTPIGIWSTANAKLNAAIAPVGRAWTRAGHDEERDLGHAEAERARRHQQERLARLRVAPASIRGTIPEADPAPAAGSWTSRWPSAPSDDADREAVDAERRHEDERAADDREVVDDRRDRRGARTGRLALRTLVATAPSGEEDRAEEHDPGQLDRLVASSAASKPGRDERRRAPARATKHDDRPGRASAISIRFVDGRDDPPGPRLLARSRTARR